MNQQEIKNKLKLPYCIDQDFDVIDNEGCLVVDSWITDMVNLHAVTHAINNTYGNGINPESVPDMYNTLQGVVLILKMLNEPKTAQDIQDILNKAAL